METKYQHTLNGQEVRQQDINLMADDAGYADDRLLWEFLRTQPGSATPQKAIQVYGVSGWAAPSNISTPNSSTALVVGNASDGKVRVAPFRAIIGSTTLFATSPIEHMRGQRSGYLVGSTTLHTEVSIAANASGNPRWTLIYAAVTPDANGATVTVKRKDPTTGVVADASVVTTKSTTVTVTSVDGTPAANPTTPSLPADAAGTYYIPLAYIMVPTGFGGASAVLREYIWEVAPVITLNSATGVPNVQPANGSFAESGAVDTNQRSTLTQPDYQPGAYLPPAMVGAEERIIPIQLSLSPASHSDGDIVDDSIDWRGRLFWWSAVGISGSTQAEGYTFDRRSTSAAKTPAARYSLALQSVAQGFGQSFRDDSSQGFPAGVTFSASPFTTCMGLAVFIDDNVIPNIGGAGAAIALYVDSSTGALKIKLSTGTAPGGQFVIWLRATAPYSNFFKV